MEQIPSSESETEVTLFPVNPKPLDDGFRVEVRFSYGGWQLVDIYESYEDAAERRRTFVADSTMFHEPDVSYEIQSVPNGIWQITWKQVSRSGRQRTEVWCLVRIVEPGDKPGKPATEQIMERMGKVYGREVEEAVRGAVKLGF